MKRFILLNGLVFNLLFANATIRTVCNSPADVAQFNTIQEAINACSTGDTILVQGSPVAYPDFSLLKKLVIIGPGMRPIRNSIPANILYAKVSNVTLSANINGSSEGSEIQGLEFRSGYTITINNSVSVNNLKLLRNHIACPLIIGYNGASSITYSGYVIEGNWFDNAYILAGKNCTYNDFIIQNNMFYGSRIEYFRNSINVLINHNLFYAGGNSGNYLPFFNDYYGCCDPSVYSQNLTIQNNIFYNANLNYSGERNCSGVCGQDLGFRQFYSIQNCTFENNITFRCNDNPWNSNSNTNAGGNLNNQSPLITSESSILAGTNDPTLDFTILGGPAYASGTDGKDMGLLFDNQGSLNWTNTRMSRIPYIFNFNITNPNIGAEDSVHINLEARINN